MQCFEQLKILQSRFYHGAFIINYYFWKTNFMHFSNTKCVIKRDNPNSAILAGYYSFPLRSFNCEFESEIRIVMISRFR